MDVFMLILAIGVGVGIIEKQLGRIANALEKK